MKKIININFQGRALPIEETAYEILKQYVDRLRAYFSQEEGGAEIINDIESRIAELFNDRIKRGASCISDDDVRDVIASIGSPEDLEAAEQEDAASAGQSGGQQSYSNTAHRSRGRFYRNEDDKILGGVCSGIAQHLGIDPVVVRVIFVLLGGALFWVYVLLWIIVPSQSLNSKATKRLYRNPDDKVIAGVCGGLAAYFHVDTWIVRLIFAVPLVLSVLSGGLTAWMWDWDDFGFGPGILTGSLSSTMFICYIILWIAVPYATTAAEKLEMRGEKVNLNSIRDTVKDGLDNLKNRAEGWSKEVEESARRMSAGSSQHFSSGSRNSGGLGRVIGVLFKAFFFLVAGIGAMALLGVFLGLMFGGVAILPLTEFLFEASWQYLLAWGGAALLIGVPLLALITWLVRRLIGTRTRNHYFGYIYTGLWILGLIAVVTVTASVVNEFRTRASVEEQQAIVQPATDKLYFTVRDDFRSRLGHYHSEWFGNWDVDDAPFYGLNRDSILLNTVRVDVARSNDSLFRIYKVRFSRSENAAEAKRLAERVDFQIMQTDSLIQLPRGFVINNKDKFRNQQVLIVVEVPVGKKIQFDPSMDDYDWFTIRSRHKNFNVTWEDVFDYRLDREYIMTPSGLELTDNASETELPDADSMENRSEDTVLIL